jgi:hypothetical protein
MQTETSSPNPGNGKGLSAANAQTPMQTGDDATARRQRQQALTPRHRRILLALLVGDRTREEVDRAAGASNSPDEVLRLRRNYGLSIPCQRKGSKDRDGHPVQVGIYRLTETDRTAARRLLAGEGVQ